MFNRIYDKKCLLVVCKMGCHLIIIQYRYTALKNEIVKGSVPICRIVSYLVNMVFFNNLKDGDSKLF